MHTSSLNSYSSNYTHRQKRSGHEVCLCKPQSLTEGLEECFVRQSSSRYVRFGASVFEQSAVDRLNIY